MAEMEVKINKEFKIPKKELENRISHSLSMPDDYGIIVPPKFLTKLHYVMAMPVSELESIFRNIPLESSKDLKSYEKSQFKFFRLDPGSTEMVQTFILEKKLLNFQTDFGNLYERFCFPGLSKMPAHYISGLNSNNEKVTGIYVPPIVEHRGENRAILIDGTHRGMIVHEAGTTIEVVGIFNPSLPLPCEPIQWHKNIVKIKPPVEERFKNFDRRFLKDFGYVGIDG